MVAVEHPSPLGIVFRALIFPVEAAVGFAGLGGGDALDGELILQDAIDICVSLIAGRGRMLLKFRKARAVIIQKFFAGFLPMVFFDGLGDVFEFGAGEIEFLEKFLNFLGMFLSESFK